MKCQAEGNLKGDQFTWAHSVRGMAMRVAKASQSECEAAACDVSMDQETQRQMKTRAGSYPSKAQFSDPHCKAYPPTFPTDSTNSQTIPQAQDQVFNPRGLWEDTLCSNHIVTN